jgi:uracil-DNA glycosylase
MQFNPKNYIDSEWRLLLQNALDLDTSVELFNYIDIALKSKKKIFPETQFIFHALNLCKPKDTKVVVVVQDPYHGMGQANGLAFSVNNGVKIPPSLRNIFLELHSDIKIPISNNGNLEAWSNEGVLLLNSSLTVEQTLPNSHSNIGWEFITNSIISNISERGGIVFILWGEKAKAKEVLINSNNNLVLKSSHPSPFSARKGFFGSKPFSKANTFLSSIGKKPINWDLGPN